MNRGHSWLKSISTWCVGLLGALIYTVAPNAVAASGCPNLQGIGSRVASSIVSASFTSSGGTTTYTFSSVNTNPSNGVPGLIEYCVYTSPFPDSEATTVTGADGTPWVIDATQENKGFFAYLRNNGNPSNIPLDGSTVTIGTATWSGTPPANQIILLHINDSAECTRLYTTSDTCFVFPGNLSQVATIKACKFNDINGDGQQVDPEPFLGQWQIDATGVKLGDGTTGNTSGITDTPPPNGTGTGCTYFTVSPDNLDFNSPSHNPITLAEELQDGWVQTAAYCPDGTTCTVDGDGVVTIAQSLVAGQTYTVYFGNNTAQEESGNVSVIKTAIPTVDWGITKDVDKTQINIPAGGTATFNYTVSVSYDTPLTMTGTIKISNSGAEAFNLVVGDSTTLGGNCTITAPDGVTTGNPLQNVDLPNGDTYLSYSCTFDSVASSSGTNTVTVFLPDGTTVLKSYNQDFTFPTVSVTDTLGGTLGTVSVTDSNPKTFTYSVPFSGDNAGTCTKHDNTATFTASDTGDTGSAGQTVTVCVGADLKVVKTAAASFTRTYNWKIAKSVDKTGVEQTGGTATFKYTVEVDQTGVTDSNGSVSGTITVSNPNDWESVTLTGVTDAVISGPSCSITSGSTTATIPAGGSTTLGYSCTYSGDPGSGTNKATATWDSTAANTPHGSASGQKDFSTGGVPTTKVDQTVTVTDTKVYPDGTTPPAGTTLGTVTGTDAAPFATKSFTYSVTVPVPTSGCVQYDNTATFTSTTVGSTTSGSASQHVTVCNAPATMGYWKNHAANSTSGKPFYSSDCSKLKSSSCSTNGPWTIQFLAQSLGGYSVSTIVLADPIWGAANCSSSTSQGAVGCLAGQLLAAELNVANKACPGNPPISTTIGNANAFLTSIGYSGPSGTYSLTAAQRATAIGYQTTLNSYNNGACF